MLIAMTVINAQGQTGNLWILKQGTNDIYKSSFGNVGINTINPQATLHLSSGFPLFETATHGNEPPVSGERDPISILRMETQVAEKDLFGNFTGNIFVNTWDINMTGNNLLFRTAPVNTTTMNTVLALNHAGNMGLGTVASSIYKLSVGGTTKSSDLEVTNLSKSGSLEVTGNVQFSSLPAGKLVATTASGNLTTRNSPILGLSGTSSSGITLTISDGNSVTFPPASGDNQILTVTGHNIHISGGNDQTLPNDADNMGNHTAATTLNMNSNIINNATQINGLTQIQFSNGDVQTHASPWKKGGANLGYYTDKRVNIGVREILIQVFSLR